MTEEKHYVMGTWKVLRPDTRQYKQQSIEIEMNIPIFVEIPEEMTRSTTINGKVVNAITLEAMKYVQDQFEKLYVQVADAIEGFDQGLMTKEDARKELVNDLEGWTEINSAPEAKKEVVTSDDGWGDDPVFDETPVTNQPDTEVWDEKEEDWK